MFGYEIVGIRVVVALVGVELFIKSLYATMSPINPVTDAATLRLCAKRMIRADFIVSLLPFDGV